MMPAHKITALIIAFSLLDYAATYKCSIGWYPGYRGNCYYFSRFSATFWNAMSFCKTVGGKLVEIDSYRELHEITRMAINKRFPNFWIGITDLYYEGAWQKATTQTRQSYFRWYSGEPNSDGGKENCVEVYTSRGMTWNDQSCADINPFVCEK